MSVYRVTQNVVLFHNMQQKPKMNLFKVMSHPLQQVRYCSCFQTRPSWKLDVTFYQKLPLFEPVSFNLLHV